ncbi:shikimate kinase AroK [Marinobacterium sp. LSUCC0821]|jgi:shikimate kinase|uniref:shikimate kinase AroK n=1 Tax=Marinobacterium sp. LSUCC0821 TaxID=2668067 RepID=UPI001451E72A|nr:shikimate kinase AroK [Marinobacterium sp. LSUCC0821]QJD72409.1 shikimate kinase AroK [Marinobacterium sp. LSUCC0821]
MGSGKSTIGRLLSNELKLDFLDSDKVIVDRAGADIPWIFDVEGEVGFRDREQAVIEQISQQDDLVLATGGGVVMREANREALRSRGFVIYLLTSIDQQMERTARDKNRPLLQTENPRATLEALLEKRDPLYRETADLILRTDRRHPRIVISEIVKALKKHRILTTA